MRQSSLVAHALLGAVVLVVAASAEAKTIKLPETAPEVTFDVPDDWTVTPIAVGLSIAPPDKSALLIAGLARRDRASLKTWQKEATAHMEAFGVTFDAKTKTPAKVAVAPTTLFSGAPTIGTPEQGPTAATAFDDKKNAGLPLEDLTGRAPPKGAKLPFNALVLYGASYLGTPVDAEFLNFALSPQQLLLMQQESGKADDRIGAIIESVRRAEK